MTGSLVLMDQAFSSVTIHKWLHVIKCVLSSFFVAGSDSSVNLLDKGAHHRTTASIVLATFFRLNGALLS